MADGFLNFDVLKANNNLSHWQTNWRKLNYDNYLLTCMVQNYHIIFFIWVNTINHCYSSFNQHYPSIYHNTKQKSFKMPAVRITHNNIYNGCILTITFSCPHYFRPFSHLSSFPTHNNKETKIAFASFTQPNWMLNGAMLV